MGAGNSMCTALVTRWDGQWQVFVLDAATGLVGTLEVESWDDVEAHVRAFLSRRHDRPAESFQVEVVHYGRRDFTPVPPDTGPSAAAQRRSRRDRTPEL